MSLLLELLMILPSCTNLTTLGPHLFLQFLLLIVITRKLWHERFGHLNYRSLQQLCKDNMVIGIPMVSCKDGVCFGCVLEKHHRDSFDKRASWHASVPLELVHIDLT